MCKKRECERARSASSLDGRGLVSFAGARALGLSARERKPFSPIGKEGKNEEKPKKGKNEDGELRF